MDWLNIVIARLRALFRREAVLEGIEEEMRLHVEMETQTNLERGMRPEEAGRAALKGFGNLGRIRIWPMRSGEAETLWQDLRYGVRGLRKQALLSAVVVATLTLGIGFSTGVFTGVNSEFLRARVDKDFDSFVRVYAAYTTDPARPGEPGRATLETYLAFRDQAKSLRNVAAYCQFDTSLGQDDPVEVRALMVTPDFFSLYGLEQPLMGRLLLPEDWAAANPVVVLSDWLYGAISSRLTRRS